MSWKMKSICCILEYRYKGKMVMPKRNYVVDAFVGAVVSTLAAQIVSSAFCTNAESDKNKQKK